MIEAKQSLTGELTFGTKNVYPSLIDLEVTPSKEKRTYKHEGSYGYDNVVVNSIPDEYIIPSLEAKVITPTKEMQTVVPSEGWDGLSGVTVNAIPDEYIVPSGELEITENGVYDVKGYESTNVNIAGVVVKPTEGITIDEYDANGYPTKITFYGNTVQDYAFSNEYSGSTTYISKNLQKVVFNDKVTTIGSNAFKKNPNLVSVNSLDEVTTLNANAFWGCNKLNVSRVNKVKYFYTYTFSECSSLIQMSMESATNILGGNSSNGAFYKCTSLKAVWIGSGITNSGFSRYSFNGCTSMIKMFIDLPRATVETFTNYQYAFMNNANKTGIIVCNDDEGFISRAEFDAIDWSTQ